MTTDYRAFAETPTHVVSTGTFTNTITGQNGVPNTTGFFHIICLADASLTGVSFAWPASGVTPDTAIALKAGAQLGGVKTFTVASGQVQFLYLF